ncbi:ComEC/Rec2 family competence protein [Bdellovibrio sp. KM01]|uniref:ComEC/Rec2 family competence protein n=1 Tax=Bdellovibrio sp. KM01 TaxID=2748865 RepID=UPI0015E942D1|nr:ComEC/Rec2 family competence protein [Bdellovibrio sp. KM01]QLY24208.1 ComEC/Rec2 family competence protein [Bdellovibrio sp. KM01]
MIILILLALSLSNCTQDTMLNNASSLSQSYQQKCLTFIPRESENYSALTSIVCGEKLNDQNLKQNLVKTSLIHIFVISGSHLLLLDELFAVLRIPFFVRFLILSFYSLIVGWQPPAVRALSALGLRGLFKSRGWKFPPDLMTMIAGCFTLALFPAWWNSPSLLMSWCASLALAWTSLLKIKKVFPRLLFNQCAVFIFMCAPLWGLSSLHPLALLYNLLLGPVVSYILLPLGFVSVIIPSVVGVFDFVMTGFSQILKWASEPVPGVSAKQISISTLWFWIFAWHIFFHFFRLRLRQGKDAAWNGF